MSSPKVLPFSDRPHETLFLHSTVDPLAKQGSYRNGDGRVVNIYFNSNATDDTGYHKIIQTKAPVLLSFGLTVGCGLGFACWLTSFATVFPPIPLALLVGIVALSILFGIGTLTYSHQVTKGKEVFEVTYEEAAKVYAFDDKHRVHLQGKNSNDACFISMAEFNAFRDAIANA